MAPLLLLMFLVVPIAELAVIVQVSRQLGTPTTVGALLLVSVAGAVLVRREGMRAWQRFRRALAEARLPADEVVDGALVLLGGALMLTPGFLTDAAGLLLVVPLTRRPVNLLLRSRTRRAFGLTGGGRRSGRGDPPPRAEVVDVDVVRMDPEERTFSEDDRRT